MLRPSPNKLFVRRNNLAMNYDAMAARYDHFADQHEEIADMLMRYSEERPDQWKILNQADSKLHRGWVDWYRARAIEFRQRAQQVEPDI